MDGWKIHDLGNDVPAGEFVETALQVGAQIIGASAMMYTTAMNIAKLREEINKRNLTGHFRLAVGGAVFKLRPELVHEVGGDGTAPNAINAPALFDRLYRELMAKETLT
jgi:methanogenic corrinoid protein MtbC1